MYGQCLLGMDQYYARPRIFIAKCLNKIINKIKFTCSAACLQFVRNFVYLFKHSVCFKHDKSSRLQPSTNVSSDDEFLTRIFTFSHQERGEDDTLKLFAMITHCGINIVVSILTYIICVIVSSCLTKATNLNYIKTRLCTI